VLLSGELKTREEDSDRRHGLENAKAQIVSVREYLKLALTAK
jgi:hypothetical protein